MIESKNKAFDACTIYLLLWALGYVQKMFISSSLISMLFYLPYMGMTLYYVVKVFTNYRPKGVMLAFTAFFVVLLCYGLALVLLDNSVKDNKSFLMFIINNLAPLFAFYCFSRQGLLTEKRLLLWFIIFLVIATLDFYTAQRKGLALLAEEGSQYEEITNNAAYSMLGLMPFVFLLRKKPMWQYIFLAYVMFIVVTGLKRGAILISLFLLLWFVYAQTKSASRGKKVLLLSLTIAFLAIGWRFVMQFYENSDYFQHRLEATLEGSSSNRDWIYSTLWNHYINNGNFLQLVFGEGGFHTVNVSGYMAHNDWLELLIDCGLFGVVVYLIYWISFIRDWVRIKSDIIVYSMMGACFIFTFMKTLFSMSFFSMPFYISMIMGYCFAQVHEIKNSDLQ